MGGIPVKYVNPNLLASESIPTALTSSWKEVPPAQSVS
jgi:hypothetical protein